MEKTGATVLGAQTAIKRLGIRNLCCRTHFLTAVLPTIEPSTIGLQRNTVVKKRRADGKVTIVKLGKRDGSNTMAPTVIYRVPKDQAMLSTNTTL